MLDDKLTDVSVTETEVNRCRAYLDYQHNHPKRPSAEGVWPPGGPAITISPQTGAGASEIAEQLSALLQAEEPSDGPPWCVFNRQLVVHALEAHNLPVRLAERMPEDRRSYFDDVVDQFMGLRPPSWELVPMIVKSILHLADAGHVILVGRGAGVATKGTPNVFHVRLVAGLPNRIERVQKREHLSPKDAEKLITQTDRGRDRFARAYFHTEVDDDLNYHLVLNTDLVPTSDAVELIAQGARRCFAMPHTAGNEVQAIAGAM
jgi:Cytidylate kinase-like family